MSKADALRNLTGRDSINGSYHQDSSQTYYAIDGSIPDLLTEYWKSLKDENNVVDFLINAMSGQQEVRAELLEIASTVIDCHALPIDFGRPSLDIAEVQRSLVEAAEVFATEGDSSVFSG